MPLAPALGRAHEQQVVDAHEPRPQLPGKHAGLGVERRSDRQRPEPAVDDDVALIRRAGGAAEDRYAMSVARNATCRVPARSVRTARAARRARAPAARRSRTPGRVVGRDVTAHASTGAATLGAPSWTTSKKRLPRPSTAPASSTTIHAMVCSPLRTAPRRMRKPTDQPHRTRATRVVQPRKQAAHVRPEVIVGDVPNDDAVHEHGDGRPVLGDRLGLRRQRPAEVDVVRSR